MFRQGRIRNRSKRPIHSIAVAVAALATALAIPAKAQDLTLETLLDRIQIEDLLTRYYYDLSQGGHVLSEYFAEDALLDVDGTVAVGHEEIAVLYGGGASRNRANTTPRPQNHMLLSNPIIEIEGDTARAHLIWTGVRNSGVGQPPSVYEQGREDSELVKIDGKWLIKRRYISSDSGTPDRFDETYEPRGNPLDDE